MEASTLIRDRINLGAESCTSLRMELTWATLILLLGILPRLAFISFFPTKPISDFGYLVDFATHFRDSIFARGTWYWEVFNPGLSVALSVILRAFPNSPEVTARWATALITGWVPLLPYLIWRRVLPFWVRVVAGILLALWPGQIFFSGVVSQDNWILFPMVALAALAVRSLIQQDRGHAVLSVVLFTLTASIRQEMLVALFPLTIAAAGFGSPEGRSRRKVAVFCLAMTLCLGGLAGYRYLGSGRFALTTEHGGRSMLGAYVPGAHWDLWTDPKPYVASVDPSLLEDGKKFLKNASRLAIREALRRPQFHVVRMVYSVTKSFARMDSSNLWWSVLSPEVLPAIYRQRIDRFVGEVSPCLFWMLEFLHVLFLASFFIGLFNRQWPILILASAILLKILIHAILVVQARYFLPVVALEMLVVALGAREALTLRSRWKPAAALSGGLVTVLFFGFVGLTSEAYVRIHDDQSQRTYRFSLSEGTGYGSLRCTIDRGRLIEFDQQNATMEFLNPAPHLGERARAVCELVRSGNSTPPLYLWIIPTYYPGLARGQMVERVVINDKELFSRDLAIQNETGRVEFPLKPSGRRETILVEVEAIRPDIGWTWGGAGRITFGLTAKEVK